MNGQPKNFVFSKPLFSGKRAVYFFIETIINNTTVKYNMYSINEYHPHSRPLISKWWLTVLVKLLSATFIIQNQSYFVERFYSP